MQRNSRWEALRDKLTGTVRPDPGTPVGSAEDMRSALLALNGRDTPFVVRDSGVAGVDLTAEYRPDPIGPGAVARQVRVLVHMRLDGGNCEVRSTDSTVDTGRSGFRGPRTTYTWGRAWSSGATWTVRARKGRLAFERAGGYSSEDVKRPLRETTIAAGWVWR